MVIGEPTEGLIGTPNVFFYTGKPPNILGGWSSTLGFLRPSLIQGWKIGIPSLELI